MQQEICIKLMPGRLLERPDDMEGDDLILVQETRITLPRIDILPCVPCFGMANSSSNMPSAASMNGNAGVN